MSRREAELTDPQHRVFLESAWAAIEHAGYEPGRFGGRIGVFGGVAANTYFQKNVMTNPGLMEDAGAYPLLLASEREYAITRVAYKLGLEGPALSVNTACSTSAVAVHLASQSLMSGESDLALAGGARVRVPLTGGYIYEQDGILSPDGHCRAFDAEARGTVAASGVAIVALKRLSDAVRDGDTIYAIVKGTAVNNDGSAKAGYTAPGVRGQAAVVGEALSVAEADAGTIGMVEAHGTGTAVGDPIEIAALTQAFRRYTDRRQFCAIGSLKTNIGHLEEKFLAKR
jgi:acyl transferase domain-containing protein